MLNQNELKKLSKNVKEGIKSTGKTKTNNIYFQTGCKLFDLVIGGNKNVFGVPAGRFINIVGDKSAGKTFGNAAIKGAVEGLGKDAAASTVYAITRPKAYNMSHLKGAILSLLNADIEDPARFNEDDVKLAFETIWGADELNKALNEENISPREMISEIRTAIRENPDLADEIRADFIKNKVERSKQ